MLTHFLLYILLISKSDCKILRNGKDLFADFNLVDANSRIKSNCIRNITHFTTEKKCSVECASDERCESFNRHKHHGFCELLAISKFNESGLLKRDIGWSHFETDDDEQNIGSNCLLLKPCAHYEVCEDTLRIQPPYRCRCKDGFKGSRCQLYKGPGTNKTNRAASCRLLMLKHESIPDGEYWFKGNDKARKCERRVDGRYTQWSLFGPCDKLCGEGRQRRNRTCTNPLPKGGGRSCEELGPKEEVRSCFIKKCPECSGKLFTGTPFTVAHNLTYATVHKLHMEYKIQLDFRMNIDKLKTNIGKYLNIFMLRYKTDIDKYTYRGPSLYLRPTNKIHTNFHSCFEDGDFNQVRINTNRKNDLFLDWVHYEISQTKVGSDYQTIIKINGNVEHTRVNEFPREIMHMKLYLSGGHDPSSEAVIKNFSYEGDTFIHLSTMCS